jgi:predicted branched-subunit amino acid permease
MESDGMRRLAGRRWRDNMQTGLVAGARAGFRMYLPISVGLVAWAVVSGMAMRSVGFTTCQAIAMNLLLFSGTAQLAALPLIAAKAPVWIIVATALVINLRFMIFSAALAQSFSSFPGPVRWLAGYMLTDGVFTSCFHKLLSVEDRNWRLGYYLAPSLWCWFLWQVLGLVGVFALDSVPRGWSLDFLATIALIVLLAPLLKTRPMLMAAAVAGAAAICLRGMPLKLGLLVAILAGVGAGFMAEQWGPGEERA